MKGRLHSIETFGAVDGPGIRTVFFMQGCPARCLYCHNPDSWSLDGGQRDIDIPEILHWAERGRPYHGEKGGVTFSGGEPLLQGEFLAEAIKALHEIGIKSAIDASGTYVDEHTEAAIAECDLVLLDIKHTDAERFEIITGRKQETLFQLIDLINKHDKHVWIRNVVVPDINDTEEDIESLNEFIKQIKHVDKVELLGYHTMAVNKYGKLGITYRLKGVPAMDGERLAELRAMVKVPGQK
ncbi:MAG: pyruvate formate lyase-activating protein [Firmicutes bacterium]|nr:pyruvate formate lyase-activating protein [Bacillota bacterium]